ncbi:MAG: hypothetical protein H0V80_14105 [Acidobacteria bacterium]|nr:hypothetical protein [Acidobacteriota bacterium]
MSLRGRRIAAGSGARADGFCWAVPPDPLDHVPINVDVWAPAGAATSPTFGTSAGRDRVATAASAPAEPYTPTSDQQAQLADLEREAFTKGYAQGERAGLEAGGKRAEAMLRRLAQTLEDLTLLRETMVRQTERELVQLSLAIARRILHREISVDPDLTAALAHIALERLGTTTPAVVRLHPDDYAVVMAGQLTPISGRQVEVRADSSVSRGGCLVESEFGYINASVDAQVDEIARAVLGEPAPAPALVSSRRGAA